MKRRIPALVIGILGISLCSGCMTYTLYEGDKRPPEELATIKLGAITEVDGRNLQYISGHDLVVLPGRHTVGLVIDGGSESAYLCTLDVVVEAEHVYAGQVELDPSGSGARPVIYVVDLTADRVVARKPPLPTARNKARAKKATPTPPGKAAPPLNTLAPSLATNTRSATNSLTWRNRPIDPETVKKLRQLRQLKTDGIITNDEYLRRGYALVGQP